MALRRSVSTRMAASKKHTRHKNRPNTSDKITATIGIQILTSRKGMSNSVLTPSTIT